jgi:hypothetical protein
MRGASTRETLDKSSLLKMPAKIKLVRGKGIKEHRVTKALPQSCKVKIRDRKDSNDWWEGELWARR